MADLKRVWAPTADGARLKPWYVPPQLPSFPATLSSPVAPSEEPEVYLLRLSKSIASHDGETSLYNGSGDGAWSIVETDGFRALFAPGPPRPDMRVLPGRLTAWPVQQVILEPEFYLVVNRVASIAPRSPVRIELVRQSDCSGELVITSFDREGSAREALSVVGLNLTKIDVSFDVRLLKEGLGVWPATLRIGGPSTPVWIDTGALRYCLMPYLDDLPPDYSVPLVRWSTGTPVVLKGRAKEKDVLSVQPAAAPRAAPSRVVVVPASSKVCGLCGIIHAPVSTYMKRHKKAPYAENSPVIDWMVSHAAFMWHSAQEALKRVE